MLGFTHGVQNTEEKIIAFLEVRKVWDGIGRIYWTPSISWEEKQPNITMSTSSEFCTSQNIASSSEVQDL